MEALVIDLASASLLQIWRLTNISSPKNDDVQNKSMTHPKTFGIEYRGHGFKEFILLVYKTTLSVWICRISEDPSPTNYISEIRDQSCFFTYYF